MNIKIILRFFAVLILVIASLGFTSCEKSRKINLKDAYVTGDWRAFIEVEDGKYLIETIKNVPRVSLRLKLLKPYTDEINDPSVSIRLTPLSKGGGVLDDSFVIESRDRFKEFITGTPGSTALISFVYPKSNRGLVSKIKNFELKTIDPASLVVTDPRRTIAVPDLTGDIPVETLKVISGNVTDGLVRNKNVLNVVDQNQIEAIQKQHMFEAGDWSDQNKYAEIGKALNVDTIAIGSVTKINSQYHLALQLIDISTFAIAGSYTNQSSTPTDLGKTGLTNFTTGINNMNISARQ